MVKEPRFSYGQEVVDLGCSMRKHGTVVEVLENFGGFGRHHYWVIDKDGRRELRHETSLGEVHERNTDRPDEKDGHASL